VVFGHAVPTRQRGNHEGGMTTQGSKVEQPPTFRISRQMEHAFDTYGGDVEMFVSAIELHNASPTDAHAVSIAKFAVSYLKNPMFWEQVAKYVARQDRGENPKGKPALAWVLMNWKWIATERPTAPEVRKRMNDERPKLDFAIPGLRSMQGILKAAHVPSQNRGGRPKRITAQK